MAVGLAVMCDYLRPDFFIIHDHLQKVNHYFSANPIHHLDHRPYLCAELVSFRAEKNYQLDINSR